MRFIPIDEGNTKLCLCFYECFLRISVPDRLLCKLSKGGCSYHGVQV